MKRLFLTYLLVLSSSTMVHAQIVINTRVKTTFTDRLSQRPYANINTANENRKNERLLNLASVSYLQNNLKIHYNELTTIHPSILLQSYSIKNFIKGASFNSTSGYNSYGYIKNKYPLINPFSPSSTFKNTTIQYRFFKKFEKESDLIDTYLDTANPIPEGERILLILSSLENVINITLENETY